MSSYRIIGQESVTIIDYEAAAQKLKDVVLELRTERNRDGGIMDSFSLNLDDLLEFVMTPEIMAYMAKFLCSRGNQADRTGLDTVVNLDCGCGKGHRQTLEGIKMHYITISGKTKVTVAGEFGIITLPATTIHVQEIE